MRFCISMFPASVPYSGSNASPSMTGTGCSPSKLALFSARWNPFATEDCQPARDIFFEVSKTDKFLARFVLKIDSSQW